MIVFENARVFDGLGNEYAEDMHVVVEEHTIKAVERGPSRLASATVVDLAGAVLLPGLIDVHVHTQISSANIADALDRMPSYSAAHATRMLRYALDCGFTSVRDVAGGDAGLAKALDDGLITGPRLFFAGRALSMTGGHADLRLPQQDGGLACSCGVHHAFGHVVDGIDQVRWAAREELRKGAHCIKIMMSGGVLSPTDPIWMNQFSDPEIKVVIEEAQRWRKYVAAHAHTAESVARCAQLGVRTIEHGTLVSIEAAQQARDAGCFIVPTLAIVMAVAEQGSVLGLPDTVRAKAEEVVGFAFEGFENAVRSGVALGFGTDLIGHLYEHQPREFLYRRDAQPADQILRSATSVGANILMRPDLGRIAPGATADLIVVDGDPLADIAVLAESGRKLPIIMKNGRFHKYTTPAKRTTVTMQ